MNIDIDLQDMQDFIKWAEPQSFCYLKEHICNKLTNQFIEAVVIQRHREENNDIYKPAPTS